MFPLYKTLKKQNPNSYHVALNGINLPSGINLREEEVDYVARTLKRILKS